MRRSDELNAQPAAAQSAWSSGDGSNPAADALAEIDATHAFNRTRADLVRAFEAMMVLGWVDRAVPTTAATNAGVAPERVGEF